MGDGGAGKRPAQSSSSSSSSKIPVRVGKALMLHRRQNEGYHRTMMKWLGREPFVPDGKVSNAVDEEVHEKGPLTTWRGRIDGEQDRVDEPAVGGCDERLHEKIAGKEWHFDAKTKQLVGQCPRSVPSAKATAESTSNAEREQWRQRWQDGVQGRYSRWSKSQRRRRFLGDGSRLVRREHAFDERCECPECVVQAKNMEAMSEQLRGTEEPTEDVTGG